MDTVPTLLLFRLYKISENAHWSLACSQPLPEGCAAVAVSGGMPDMLEIRRRRLTEPDEQQWVGPQTPFLHSAPNAIVSRVVWALLGSGGRFYPIYVTGSTVLASRGFAPESVSGVRSDVLASPKLASLHAAMRVDWSQDFLTCFSDGIGLGFWGDVRKLEKRLKRSPDFAPRRMLDEIHRESFDQRLQDTHPYLHTNWQENGFGWLLENSQLVMRPQGWEGEDAIFLSNQMSHDAMIAAIHREFGDQVAIEEYDGNQEYLRWASWPFGDTTRRDQWLA